jgi:hypothetical protein
MDPESLESKFTKSRTNKRTENSGLAFSLQIGASSGWTHQRNADFLS